MLGEDVIIHRLGIFGRIRRIYRVDGNAMVSIKVEGSHDLEVAVSPVELTRRREDRC